MTFDGNSFSYFPENELTKLANLLQFLTLCLVWDWGACALWAPFVYATAEHKSKKSKPTNNKMPT